MARLRNPIMDGFCFEIGHSCGFVDGDMDLVVIDAVGAALLAIAVDPVHHLAEAGQGFDVDVDLVTRLLLLVALHRNLGLKIPQSAEVEPAENPGDGGEGRLQQPGATGGAGAGA